MNLKGIGKNFLSKTPILQVASKTVKSNCKKVNGFYTAKDIANKLNRLPTELKKTFDRHTTDRG